VGLLRASERKTGQTPRKRDVEAGICTFFVLLLMNVYSRKARIQQHYTFGFSSSIVKCLASDNGYGSPPDDDVHEPVKRRSPWDDVFGEESEDSLEDVSPLSRSSSVSKIETPKTLPKRQRGHTNSCVVEKTTQLLALLRSRVSRLLSENKRLSTSDQDKDLGSLVLLVQKLMNENADPLVKDGNGIRALQYLVILCDCPLSFESLFASASVSVTDDAILGGNFLDLCLASKRTKCVEAMVTAGMTPMLPPLYRSCCVVRRLKLMLAIEDAYCNPSMSLCEVCASFSSSRRPHQNSSRSRWSDTAELAPSILSFLARSQRCDLMQMCKDNLAELCSSGELGVCLDSIPQHSVSQSPRLSSH
jgi:hypothetical protein